MQPGASSLSLLYSYTLRGTLQGYCTVRIHTETRSGIHISEHEQPLADRCLQTSTYTNIAAQCQYGE